MGDPYWRRFLRTLSSHIAPKSKYLLRSVFAVTNHYYAVLPYNLNWQFQLGTREREFLVDHPLIVSDVGARGAAPEELAPFYSHMIYHGFDADKTECDRLNSSPHQFLERQIYPVFIGSGSQAMNFYLYKRPGESSPYLPNTRFKQVFQGNDFEIEKETKVFPVSLDDVYRSHNIPLPDFVKLDTQGSELAILRGASAIIEHACLFEIEVEFVQMYDNQPLFHDVMKLMTESGFELLYLNRVFGQRQQIFQGKSRGQMIFGDALFGRREDALHDFTEERIIKYILLLAEYGHLDFASHLLLLHPDIGTKYPMLGEMISNNCGTSRWKKLLLSQIDKIIMLLLHARKYNQSPYDSDRGWPTR